MFKRHSVTWSLSTFWCMKKQSLRDLTSARHLTLGYHSARLSQSFRSAVSDDAGDVRAEWGEQDVKGQIVSGNSDLFCCRRCNTHTRCTEMRHCIRNRGEGRCEQLFSSCFAHSGSRSSTPHPIPAPLSVAQRERQQEEKVLSPADARRMTCPLHGPRKGMSGVRVGRKWVSERVGLAERG